MSEDGVGVSIIPFGFHRVAHNIRWNQSRDDTTLYYCGFVIVLNYCRFARSVLPCSRSSVCLAGRKVHLDAVGSVLVSRVGK